MSEMTVKGTEGKSGEFSGYNRRMTHGETKPLHIPLSLTQRHCSLPSEQGKTVNRCFYGGPLRMFGQIVCVCLCVCTYRHTYTINSKALKKFSTSIYCKPLCKVSARLWRGYIHGWSPKLCFLFFLSICFYFFMAVLGLRFCARAFSSCGKRGPLFIVVHGPLTIAASLVAEHRLQTRRLSSCGSRA